jgi:hypothetical protein
MPPFQSSGNHRRGILRCQRATRKPFLLINAGATWVDAPTFGDDNLVWRQVVCDIRAFCHEPVAALVQAAESA